MSNVILFPGCELPSLPTVGSEEAGELDHANREALAALELSTLILARNRRSLAWPDADKARKEYERIEAMREGWMEEPLEEFDWHYLLNLRVARAQIQWLLDRVERKQARAKARREG